MKLNVHREKIIGALQKMQSIVNARPSIPVLANILLEARNGHLVLTATDLEITVRCRMEADIAVEGETTLPARRLFAIFRELSTAEVEVERDEQHIVSLRSGTSFFKLNGLSSEAFPKPADLEEEMRNYVLDQGVFREMLQKTSYAASEDETRQNINGVLLSFRDEKLAAVATDGRRMALVEQEVEFPEVSEAELIIPLKTVLELIRTLEDKGVLKIKAGKRQIAFEFGELYILSKLVDAEYPNFRQVIPDFSEYRVVIEREALLGSLRRAALMTNEQSNAVKLIFMENCLEVVTQTPDVGEAKERLPIKYDGAEIIASFNPEFLMDPLRTLSSDEIYFEISDSLSPGVIKTNVPFLYVIMPVRIA